MSYAIIIEAEDGSRSAFGPFTSLRRTATIERQLRDWSSHYNDTDGPDWGLTVVSLDRWPGIRAVKREPEGGPS